MLLLLSSVLFGCGEEETTYACAEGEILQECDSKGENCEDVEDCTERDMICHAEMGHCMPMEDDEEPVAEE